jgi:secretion/DNA translocation related TadE-like protein
MSGSDAGSGSMLALGIGASFLLITFLLIPLLGGLVVHQRLQGATDLAALAAADAASGRQPGYPCVLAENLLSQATFSTLTCRVDGPISWVIAQAHFGPFELSARARAGPASRR